jgi:GAF domain-containing protein
MAQKEPPAAGFWEQARDLFEILDSPRRPGYIGRLPYLLILRIFIVLGIAVRFLLYPGHFDPAVAAWLVALVLVIVLARWPIQAGLGSTTWKTFVVVALDTAVINVVYWSTQHLQSDTYLYFFLPILSAAEYLRTRWVATVFGVITITFLWMVYIIHPVDTVAHMTLREALLRLYLVREFFLLGLVFTAWYLFQQEKQQQRSLENAHDDLDQASGPPWVFHYPSSDGVHPEAAPIAEKLRSMHEGLDAQKLDGCAVEPLEIGNRNLGSLAVGVRSGQVLRASVAAFLKALTGPLLNGLRRSLLIESLRRIDRATLRAFDFDSELSDTLREATEELHMEFATITLKDEYRGVVETVRGRNVPPGLLRLSRYRTDAPDIQTHVIANGTTMVWEGNHELFNPEIFEFFEHDKLARIWTPLRNAENEVIGTIEGGCARERNSSVLTEENCRRFEELAARKGPLLSNLRPQALLKLIAEEAIALIGADSASVHVFQSSEPLSDERRGAITQVDFAAHFHCTEPVLAAGAGKAGPDFIQAHSPRPQGIGWRAILAAWRGDPEGWQKSESRQLGVDNPQIYGEGVRAILAIPLRVGSNLAGVLYVHHRNREQFTNQEIQIERVFAAQIEVAIQSYFLLRNTALAVHDSRSLLDWLSVTQSPAKLGDPAAVLEELAQRLLLVADADNVVLYQYVKERREFLRPILKGKLLNRAAMRTEVTPAHLVYKLIEERLPHFYEDVAGQKSALTGVRSDASPRFVDREQIRSCAVLELRARADDELFGVLFVNFRKPQRFTREQKNTMQVLAASAAAVIRTARFYEWMKKRQQHIDSLREIDAAIVASAKELKPDAILSSILSEAQLTSGGWAGAVFMLGIGGQLETRVAARPEDHSSTHRLGAGVVGTCAKNRKPLIIPSIEPVGFRVNPKSKSCMAVPLLDGGGARGVLYVEGEREGAFAVEDARVLETLAVQAVIALHTIESYHGLDLERSRAEALSLVAKEIQNSSYSLDLILYLILTGITAGESLGFSRAIIFERPEGGDVLRGRSAVGEVSLTRARGAWEGLGKRTVKDALETAIKHYESGAANNELLMQAVRGMEIPLDQSGGAIAECVLDQSNQPCFVESSHPDTFRERLAGATSTEYTVPYACIPLVVRKEIIGVLVVDNRFQPGESEPLSPEMIARVAAYAELAAMSIEAARLLDKTQTQTYEDLAHQLRTPINIAHRYCEDLISGPPDETNRGNCKLRSLKAAVDSAVYISQSLQHYADLASGKQLDFESVRLEPEKMLQSVKESVCDFAILHPDRGFRVLEESFSVLNQVGVAGDLKLIREALENLLDNASKYSFPNSMIEIGAAVTNEPFGFEIYVEDQGIPVTGEQIDRLAERGWRAPAARAVAASGSGIGLWVVAGIMRTLDGQLEATPTSADGRTRMRLWLPEAKEQKTLSLGTTAAV